MHVIVENQTAMGFDPTVRAMERLQAAPISRVIVTDTIPCGQRCEKIADKLTTLSVAGLLGQAIHRIHHDQSVSALFRPGMGGKR